MSGQDLFADHFSGNAAEYSRYRPGYPRELFDYLTSLCPSQQRMWDCATGSGQAAGQFAGRFDTVLASDASFEQIRNAQRPERIFYLIGPAEQAPFADHSLDLITVAQALHWFDLDRFYAEARRLLKPNGVLAVWTYNLTQINPAIDEVIQGFYSGVLGDYWPFERRLVESGYRHLSFPFTEQQSPRFAMQAEWSLDHLLGYLSTWSAVKRYREEQGNDPLQLITPQLSLAWGERPVQTVSWPLSLRIGTP